MWNVWCLAVFNEINELTSLMARTSGALVPTFALAPRRHSVRFLR